MAREKLVAIQSCMTRHHCKILKTATGANVTKPFTHFSGWGGQNRFLKVDSQCNVELQLAKPGLLSKINNYHILSMVLDTLVPRQLLEKS